MVKFSNMYSFAKALLSIIILQLFFLNSFAQQNACNLTFSGRVICSEDGNILPFSVIGIDNGNTSLQSDINGKFSFAKICRGTHKVNITLLGYQKLDTVLNISSDTVVTLFLKSKAIHFSEVHVDAIRIQRQEVETISKIELSGIELQKTRGEDLGNALKEIAGVSVINAGPTISKPVVHGLHSNRILILNNGVRQEGQQWGSEHAPEIDPFIATKLSVIKGAASIRYGADAIGGVVLVEPAELPEEKGLGGEVNLVGIDNGRLYTGSGILQGAFDKNLSGLSYRIQGTYRKAGNLQTPHYYLDNTGLLEKNYSGALGYKKEHFGADLYYSRFNTEVGIYTGSHVGNPKELLQAFSGEKPVEDYGFSYNIKRGYQTVNHELVKASAFYKSSGFGKINAIFALQSDLRQEFDFHIPYTSNGVDLSNAPQVYFQLITHTGELIWEHNAWHHITGSVGGSFITQGNVFKGLTYRSLIPNFRNYGGGAFIIEKWTKDKLTLEAGIRGDYKWQREYMLNNNTLKIEMPTQEYKNLTGTIGAIYRISSKLSLNLNAGNAWRAPSVYELYAYGIHGSTSTFEIGDSLLENEKAYNLISSLKFESKYLQAELGVYTNYILNYIYAKPQPGKYAVTYQGSYPLFYFTQTDALYKGIDLDLKWKISKHLKFSPKATLVFANDLRTDDYLVLVPSQRFQATIEYKWEQVGKLKDVFINFGSIYVTKQTRVPANSDFVPPPNSYSLLSASVGLSIPAGKQKINVNVQADNILNTVYRDYMNLFRYYADNPGRNIQLRIQIPFQIINNNSNNN